MAIGDDNVIEGIDEEIEDKGVCRFLTNFDDFFALTKSLSFRFIFLVVMFRRFLASNTHS